MAEHDSDDAAGHACGREPDAKQTHGIPPDTKETRGKGPEEEEAEDATAEAGDVVAAA
jgi:hypothetical protein